MGDEIGISATTARRAIVRAAGPLLVAGQWAALLLLVWSAPGAAALVACGGLTLGLAAAVTAFAEAHPRRGDLIALGLGAAVGGGSGLQVVIVHGAVSAGSPGAGLTALQALGEGALLLVITGAVVGAAALVAVVQHRLDLDPADRLAGTQGDTTRAVVRSVLLAWPTLAAAPIAGIVATALFACCFVDEQVHRALARRAGRRPASRLAGREVPRERLELAAYAGDPAARQVGVTPFVPDDLRAWAEGLRVFGPEACARAVIGALSVAVPAHERAVAGDRSARAAWRALEAWAVAPGPEALAAARTAAEAVTPPDAPTARAARAAADAASREGAFGPGLAGRDAGAGLAAAAEATGDAAVVREAAALALRAWALG